MKLTVRILLVLLLQACLFSCNRRPYPHTMQVADSLVDLCPDSTLSLLERIKDSINSEPEETRMYYKLLLIKAKDKAYITHTSDSTIKAVLKYYRNRKDKNRLLQVYYYAGRVYSDLEDAPRALHYFLRAIDVSHKSTDYKLISAVYSQTGTLYLYQQVYDKAPEMFHKAYRYSILANDSVSMVYDLRDIGRYFSTQQNSDSAIYYYIKADKLSEKINNQHLKRVVNGELAGYYMELGRYEEAYQAMQIAFSHISSRNLPSRYAVAGHYYESTNQLDSAAYYYSQLLSINNSLYKQEAYRGLSSIARHNGEPIKALAYLDKYLEYTDSLQKITQTETVSHISSLYNYQLHQKENRKLRIETYRERKWNFLLAISLIFCVILFIAYYQYRKRKEQAQHIQQEKLKKMQEEQYKLSLAHIEQNKAEIKKLELALKEAENAKDKLRQDLLQSQKDFIEKTNEQIEAKHKVQKQSEAALINSKIYEKFYQAAKSEEKIKDEDWQELACIIDETYNQFTKRLYELYPIKDMELKVCLLLKIGLKNAQIATIVILSKQAITSIRKRLNKKVFEREDSPEQWDNFISNF